MSRAESKKRIREQSQRIKNEAKAAEQAKAQAEQAKAQAKLDAILNSIKTEEGRAKILEDIKNYVASNKDLSLDDMLESLEYYTRIIIEHDPHSSGADFKASTLFDKEHSDLSPMTKTILTMIANVIERNGKDASGKERAQLKHLENGLRKLENLLDKEIEAVNKAMDEAARLKAAEEEAARLKAAEEEAARLKAAEEEAAKKLKAAEEEAAADKLQESKDSSVESLQKIINALTSDPTKTTNVFKDYCSIVKMEEKCDESSNIFLENSTEGSDSFCCPFSAHEDYKAAAEALLGAPAENSPTEL